MWIALVSSLLLITFVDSSLTKGNGILKSDVNPLITEFKTNVHHILEGTRIRKKRQLEDSDPLIHKLKFESASIVDLPYLQNYSLTFWIPVREENANQILIGTTSGHIILFQTLDENDKSAQIIASTDVEDIAVKAKAFSYYGKQWFAVLHSSEHRNYIQLYERIGRGLEKWQNIDLTGVSDIDLVTMKGIHYLIVASYSSTIGQSFTYQASVTLYYWDQTQFDATASRTVYGARSVVCWILDGSLYIAVAQETNDERNMAVGSPIFLYNSKEENRLVLWQILSTLGPIKVQHFFVAGSHYIVVIGRREAAIYWWSSGQFLEWQILSGTADALDVSVLALGNGEVAIVIVLKEETLFYTLDSSGHYIITLPVKFSGLRALQFMFSGNAYYALALFAESQQQSIWKLKLGSHFVPSVKSLDPLQQCLLDMEELLKERQSELIRIKDDLGRVWLKGSNQTINSKVVVRGNIVSNQQSIVRDVIIIKYANVPDASMSLVIATLTELYDSVSNAKQELDGTVLKSSRQDIRGFKHFEDLVYVPSVTMESVATDVVINDVSVARLRDYAIRKFGNQAFLNKIQVSSAYSDTVIASTLNGISIEDFLLLHGAQTVTGSLAFSDVFATDLFVGSLNSIPTEDMITTHFAQNIRSLKSFSSLASKSIDVARETNEVDLGGIYDKIVTIDEYAEFLGQLTFKSPLTINGDLFLTGNINKVVDISALVDKSVKRDIKQDLKGHYTFKGKQTIKRDLIVGGYINKISLDNLLTLSSNQKIYADMSFLDLLTIKHDLHVGLVNGVDLSELALRKSAPHQFVIGRKTFTEDIQADFVDMTDYVTLDGVDPSFLVQDFVQHKQGVVKENATVLKNVEILGNLNVLGDINGVNILDFISSVWLKSFKQNITVPVSTSYLTFKNDLDVNTVNNLNLDSDVVHTHLDEEIEAEKTFEFKTVVKTVRTVNSTINGMDMKSFKIQLERFRNEWEVQGTKEVTSLELLGDLEVTTLNELKVDALMQPAANQNVNGEVQFTDEITYVKGNTRSGTVSFELFNDKDLRDYFRNSVILSQDYKLLKDKNFNHLKSTNMLIPPGSKISGVSLDELKHRAVTLNESQLITSPKTFASELNFKKLVFSAKVNGIDLSSLLNEVVLTDEVSKISNKEFSADIESTNAFVRGGINGIKIEDVAENVFYKSKDNVVTERFIFEGDVDADDFQSPVIDEVVWKDLIFLQKDETLGTGWFLSNVYADGDIFVNGLLNGCDLSRISSILYADKSTQIINKTINVRNFIVVGSLKVKKSINKLPVKDLQNLISISEDQIITSDVLIDADLIFSKLQLEDLANAGLASIVKDAVRHSIPQDITAQKTFKNGISAIVLTGGDVFASKVNGIDLEELESTTVWKDGHHEIGGDKIFPSLSMNVAVVNGYLNGLKLPEDIIKAETSEFIAQPTYFMSDVYISTDLLVKGLIDGVDLNNLIQNRITLSSEQNITAELTFYDDVVLYDELTVDGTINEIVLDLVAKVKPIHPLQGYKVFVELHVSGPLVASSVNGLDVSQLANSILKYNKDETIREIQVFEKPLQAQNSLFVEWVNSVPINHLTSAFTTMMNNLRSVLGYLEDLSSSLQQTLVLQMSATQNQIYQYAYFTLFQELDVGPASRILYGYSLEQSEPVFSHSLIVWTEVKRCIFMEKCCHLDYSYWLRVKKDGIAMVDIEAESGRYYPIPNESPAASDKFLIWTNASGSEPEWCMKGKSRMVLTSDDGQYVYMDTESSSLLSDVKSFRSGQLYAVASFYFDPKHGEYGSTVVYVYGENRRWSEHQVLPSFGVLSLDIISHSYGYRQDILLALGTGMNTDPPSYSTVYKWNNDNRAFDIVQNIPSQYVTSTLWIRRGRSLLLSLASVEKWPNKAIDCSELVSGGKIDIFSYEENLHWIQSIPIGGVVSMISFSVDGDVYLAASSIQDQAIYIFEWRGYSGFVKMQTISAEAHHLNIYNIDEDVYMTLASVTSHSKILKMVRKGRRTSSLKSYDVTSLEQRDEVPKEPNVVKGC